MISFILDDRCTACGVCVAICPTNVFDLSVAAPPVIVRQNDCQTCFLCELYCEADAIYVDPNCDHPVAVDEGRVIDTGLLGQFRRDSGWHEWADDPRHSNEHWRMSELFSRAAALNGTRRHM